MVASFCVILASPCVIGVVLVEAGFPRIKAHDGICACPNETPLSGMNSTKLMEEAAVLLKKHNLLDWSVELRPHTGFRLGGCHYRLHLIALNTFYVANNSEEMVVDTLLHQVAHALTPGHQHDVVWKAMAIQLGCRPDRNAMTGLVLQPGRYKAVCPTCQAIFYKYRKPRYIRSSSRACFLPQMRRSGWCTPILPKQNSVRRSQASQHSSRICSSSNTRLRAGNNASQNPADPRRLQPRIHRLAFQGEDAEDAFVDSA